MKAILKLGNVEHPVLIPDYVNDDVDKFVGKVVPTQLDNGDPVLGVVESVGDRVVVLREASLREGLEYVANADRIIGGVSQPWKDPGDVWIGFVQAATSVAAEKMAEKLTRRSRRPDMRSWPWLTETQRAALCMWARRYGPRWKQRLREAWVDPNCPEGPELRALRDSHGYRWLSIVVAHVGVLQ